MVHENPERTKMTLPIKEFAGLDISVDAETFAIRLGSNIEAGQQSVRTWDEMREFAVASDIQPSRHEIYYVARNIAQRSDADRIKTAHLRYDITIIPPGMFVAHQRQNSPLAGRRSEYFRTAGHYHPIKPGTSIGFPEVYEVLYGHGYFVIQRPDPKNAGILLEVYAVEAAPGEKIVMPPGFGHISINAFNQPLILSNWIADTFEYDYTPYKRFMGGGYWLVEGLVRNTIEFEKNTNYTEVPNIIKLRPKELPEFGLAKRRPMYSLVQDIEKLSFLSSPEDFVKDVTIERCFRML